MRTFIAIELSREIKETLSGIQDELKKAGADVKWVKTDNIHLTLKFLGEVREEKIPKIAQSLKESTNLTAPFDIQLDTAGVFPDLKFPRVVWIGIEEGKEKLIGLANQIEDMLVSLKFPKEKRGFSAHITIGRVRSAKNKDALIQKLKQVKPLKLTQQIKSIALFKSTLTPEGPAYEKLAESSFTKI